MVGIIDLLLTSSKISTICKHISIGDWKMKRSLILFGVCFVANANAQVLALQESWLDSGIRYCKYTNGETYKTKTYKVCPNADEAGGLIIAQQQVEEQANKQAEIDKFKNSAKASTEWNYIPNRAPANCQEAMQQLNDSIKAPNGGAYFSIPVRRANANRFVDLLCR